MRQLPLITYDCSSPWWSWAGRREPGSSQRRMVAVLRSSSTVSVFMRTPGNGSVFQGPSSLRTVRLFCGVVRMASRMRRRSSGGGATGSIVSATIVSSTSSSSPVRSLISVLPRNLHAQCRHSVDDHTTQFRFSEPAPSGQFAKSEPVEEELFDQACRTHHIATYVAGGGLALPVGQRRFASDTDARTEIINHSFGVGGFPPTDDRLLQRRRGRGGGAGNAQRERVRARRVRVVENLDFLGTHYF